METLFDGSIVFLYLLGTFVIINYEMFSKKQKVIIIYVLSYGMLINGNVGILEILALMLLTLFIYEELLNEDKCKCQYVHGVVDRILDYLFMYVFIYKILYIVFGFLIYYKGTQFFEMVNKGRMTGFTCRHVTLILSAVFLFVAAIRMLNDGISLHSFSEINAKFQKYPYYKFLGLSNRDEVKKKLEMVTEVEDKTFFLEMKGLIYVHSIIC